MTVEASNGTDRTDGQPPANETRFAGHLLSTDNEWADLDGPEPRRPYNKRQLRRWEHYEGPLADMPEETAWRLLSELLEYFMVEGFDGMPLPPSGLPGCLNKKVSWNDPEWELLSIGYDYFLSVARHKTRAMHNRWDDAGKLIRRHREAAREELVEQQMQRQTERNREREEAVKEQLVYFIATQSGPIKIGIAINPDGRCKSLQTSHHERLEVLATCPGGQELEQVYHKRFAAHRLHGEWFERCPEILGEIERLAA